MGILLSHCRLRCFIIAVITQAYTTNSKEREAACMVTVPLALPSDTAATVHPSNLMEWKPPLARCRSAPETDIESEEVRGIVRGVGCRAGRRITDNWLCKSWLAGIAEKLARLTLYQAPDIPHHRSAHLLQSKFTSVSVQTTRADTE